MVLPGEPFPLGATWDGSRTNFSLFSEVATRVELCLFDAAGVETRIDLPDRTAFCWHGSLAGVRPGQRYGFRVHGPWAPNEGHRCNPSKLLMDPYAHAISGAIDWNATIFPYPLGGDDLVRDESDSGPHMPRSVVVDPAFDWEGDRRPGHGLQDTLIYEMHVKGFTMKHPDVPPELRGTYAGLAHPAAIAHLTSLGVTAVELLPVHQFIHEKHLLDRGLRNYWGYHSYGYLAPHGEYSASGDGGQQVVEFKQMVKALHAAGLEVILDVVYNHTGEGNHLGPMLCFKGADNRAYYRVKDDEPRYYLDYTGTGNSLNMRHPHSLMLIMDSLRYWVREMHVDGFRFDLASTLARELYDVDRLSAFFDIIHQDPTLASVKLIAEPWDLGDGGYQVGNFPVRWCEWNGKYRDSVRDFWRGGGAPLGEFARRFTGSADLYEEDGRRPYASVNFITAHDGFTLRDLLSYNEKHNEANGEDNADGESHNRSWNCGVEGETDNPEVIALRAQQQRNLLTTLLLSHGIPMLLSGDEIGRTQRGNNNAYCQDNDISWTDWAGTDAGLFAFCRRLITFRQRHPVFRRRRWLTDAEAGWFRPDGQPMQNGDWEDPEARALGVYLDGAALDEVDERGRHVRDGRFVLLFNAAAAPTTFVLPVLLDCAQWLVAIDSTSVRPEGAAIAAGEEVAVPPCGVLVLECG